ncbi:hypothetical protein PSPO01_00254 [Paraphaeosphaeria sporulosa]
MKMNLMIATAILAWCESVDAAPRPQVPGLVPLVLAAGTTSGTGGLAVAKPLVPGIPLPPLPIPGLPGVPPVAPGLTLPAPAPLGFPPVPLLIPNLPSPLPKLPVVDLPIPAVPKVPGPGDVPALPISLPPVDADSVDSYVKVGKIVLSNILNLLWQGAKAAKIPGLEIPAISVPAVPVKNATLPVVAAPALKKRQVAVSSSARPATATPAVGLPLVGGLTSGLTSNLPLVGGLTSGLTGGSSPLAGVTNTVSGVTGSLPVVGGLTSGLTGGSSPVSGVLNTVSGVTNSLPVVGGLTGGLTGGASDPLSAVGGVVGTVANTVGSVPVVGGAVAPVLGAVGGSTSGNPLGAVGGAVSGALGTVGQVAGSVPVVGGAVQGAVNTVGQAVNSALLGPYPLNQGVPGSDPVGGLSVSIIATLLSLLKKDPLSLFGGGLGGIGGLIKRDLPALADQLEIEKRSLSHAHKKRQLSLPSLSTGVPGVGVGALPLSGVPGVSPDISFLVGSIAKNIAVPGGKGLGSVTGNILSVLNGVVPNFLFKLPVVQDSVPTFGCLQLLSSINPTKFGSLADLTNLAALSTAANGISSGDLAFIRTLPSTADPSNLITTITTLTDNILSLPGNVANLKAAVAVLCLKNLGLAVPGL